MSNTNIRGMTATGFIWDDIAPYLEQQDYRNFETAFITTPNSHHLTNYPSYDGIFGRYGRNTNSVYEFKTAQVKYKSFYMPTTRHKQISDDLNDPEVLTSPEKYFGPNYKALLNFWIYWDSLNFTQRCDYQEHIISLLSNTIWQQAYREARRSSGRIMDCAVCLHCWEMEIVGMHIILDEGKPLTFIPLLENL